MQRELEAEHSNDRHTKSNRDNGSGGARSGRGVFHLLFSLLGHSFGHVRRRNRLTDLGHGEFTNVHEELLSSRIVDAVIVRVDPHAARRSDSKTLNLLEDSTLGGLKVLHEVPYQDLLDGGTIFKREIAEVDMINTLDGGIGSALVVALENKELALSDGGNIAETDPASKLRLYCIERVEGILPSIGGLVVDCKTGVGLSSPGTLDSDYNVVAIFGHSLEAKTDLGGESIGKEMALSNSSLFIETEEKVGISL